MSIVWNQCIYSILILSYLASLKTEMIEMKANNIEHWTSHIYQMIDISTSRHCQFNVVRIQFFNLVFKIAQFKSDLTLCYFHIIMTSWRYIYEYYESLFKYRRISTYIHVKFIIELWSTNQMHLSRYFDYFATPAL